jgi:hypothetical protein
VILILKMDSAIIELNILKSLLIESNDSERDLKPWFVFLMY